MAVALAAAPRASAGQADSLSGFFRYALTEIAAAGGIPRLDSTQLAPGVRREIRVYAGFGFGGNVMLRLWEDGSRVHGRLGKFWHINEFMTTYDSRAAERAGHAKGRAYDARMRAFVDSVYGCRSPPRSTFVNACWIAERPDSDSWARLLATLDSLRINDIPYPALEKRGTDGWSVLVEVRTPARYRSYMYWMPDTLSANQWERATARIGNVVAEELMRHSAK